MIWGVVALAFLAGLALGLLSRVRRPAPVEPRPLLPDGVSRRGVPILFADRARAIVDDAPRVAAICGVASDAWSLGVTELRDEIVASTGLPAGIAADVADRAVVALLAKAR